MIGRAIYSDVCGFLGGVGWAILVAKICQLYPNVSAGAIVDRFFIIMHQWYRKTRSYLERTEGSVGPGLSQSC